MASARALARAHFLLTLAGLLRSRVAKLQPRSWSALSPDQSHALANTLCIKGTHSNQKAHTSDMPPAAKLPKHDSGIKKATRTKKRDTDSYAGALRAVLKSVHPTLTISSKSIAVMDSFVKNALERIASEAATLVKTGPTATLDARAIRSASGMVLCRGIGKHAHAAAQAALLRSSGSVPVLAL